MEAEKKTVFVSQAMHGRPYDDISDERNKLITVAKDFCGPDTEILDSFFRDFDGNAVSSLAQSIGELSRADMAIFGPSWEQARGCRIERAICEAYGIPIIHH